MEEEDDDSSSSSGEEEVSKSEGKCFPEGGLLWFLSPSVWSPGLPWGILWVGRAIGSKLGPRPSLGTPAQLLHPGWLCNSSSDKLISAVINYE